MGLVSKGGNNQGFEQAASAPQIQPGPGRVLVTSAACG